MPLHLQKFLGRTLNTHCIWFWVSISCNSLPHNPNFELPRKRKPLETLWEKEKMLETLWITNVNFTVIFNLLSANDLNLDMSNILSFGKEVNIAF